MPDKLNEIEKFRAQIDIIDQTILELIGKRYHLSNRIGAVKQNMKLKIINSSREKELLDNLKEKARQLNLNEKLVEDLWVKIISESRKAQKFPKVQNG